MIALGVDVSTKKIAFSTIDDDGRIVPNVHILLGDHRGARRLCEARRIARTQARRYSDLAVAVVEIPWARSGSSFALLSIAAVCLEAVQAEHPGAVVLDLPTQSWKLDSVGRGNASKDECMAYAHGLGMMGADQDVADATCMAQAAWYRWSKAIRSAAA